MSTIKRIALFFVIVGAINWGLIGFFQFDLVASLFGGQNEFMSRVIYGLVGLSGLICIPLLFEPMRDIDVDTDRASIRKLNYETEFSEEPEFTNVKTFPKKDKDEEK